MSDELRRTEREIRAWTARPPATSPRAARARVLARIEERRQTASWKLAAVAGVLVAGLIGGLSVLGPGEPTPRGAPAGSPVPRILVYELKSGTRLYLALAAPAVQAPASIEKANASREGDGP